MTDKGKIGMCDLTAEGDDRLTAIIERMMSEVAVLFTEDRVCRSCGSAMVAREVTGRLGSMFSDAPDGLVMAATAAVLKACGQGFVDGAGRAGSFQVVTGEAEDAPDAPDAPAGVVKH